jgi:hypothetical protein
MLYQHIISWISDKQTSGIRQQSENAGTEKELTDCEVLAELLSEPGAIF